MKLIGFVAYLRENRSRFCDVQCWEEILPCEKCVLILTLHLCLVNKKYQKMHYMFENSVFKDDLMEIYRKHFLKENKDETFICNIFYILTIVDI